MRPWQGWDSDLRTRIYRLGYTDSDILTRIYRLGYTDSDILTRARARQAIAALAGGGGWDVRLERLSIMGGWHCRFDSVHARCGYIFRFIIIIIIIIVVVVVVVAVMNGWALPLR